VKVCHRRDALRSESRGLDRDLGILDAKSRYLDIVTIPALLYATYLSIP